MTSVPVRRPSVHRRAEDRERGAAMVEFALLAPVLFMLIFGIIDFGVLLSNDIGIRQGVRESARQAAVAEFGSTTSCGASTLSSGASTEMRRLVCLTKARSDVRSSSVRVAIRFDPTDSGLPASGAYPSGTGSPPVGNGIIVCATAPMESTTGFFSPLFSGKHLRTKVVMRIEKAAGTAQAPVQEVDPSGDGWSWCTP